MILKLSELAARVRGEIQGDPGTEISGVNGLLEAKPWELSFYGNPRYREDFAQTRAGAVLVGSDAPTRPGLTVVRVANPHLAFAYASRIFHPPRRCEPGVSVRALVDSEARVDASATVMGGAFVGRRASIGARTVLFPGSFVGEEARVGEDCTVYANAVIREQCVIGHRVILHAGCVVGADGFGFAFDPETGEHVKIPQVGIVRIEDDVEIGACSCLDRATIGETVIRQGTKIDNLVQIAHNVTVGPRALLCAQVGISGSSQVGEGAILAGQVGVVGHIRIGDRAIVGAQSGVAQRVEAGERVSGYPSIPHQAWLRASTAFSQLPGLLRQVQELRRRVSELEAREKP